MAKNKLIIEYDYDFTLFGIISPIKDYKLAWLINRRMGVHLVKVQDIRMAFLNEEELVISNYLYETENTQLRMLKNRSEENKADKMGYLLPELNRFDYFIMQKGITEERERKEWFNQLKEFKEIQYITPLEIEKIRSKDNLLF